MPYRENPDNGTHLGMWGVETIKPEEGDLVQEDKGWQVFEPQRHTFHPNPPRAGACPVAADPVAWE